MSMVAVMETEAIRGIDIFCGAGGSIAGARAAGVEIVAGVDMCSIATATFAANFPAAHVVTSRLEDLSIDDYKERIGPIDLLLASPECRNHTCAKGSAPRNESSRATAMQLVRYARLLRPRWLVLENVVYMRPWSRYQELKSRLEELDYRLAEHTLDASEFGVPQTRRRLFLVGDRERCPDGKPQIHDGPRKAARSILDPAGTWNTSSCFVRAGHRRLWSERGVDSTRWVSRPAFCWCTTGATGLVAGNLWIVPSVPFRRLTASPWWIRKTTIIRPVPGQSVFAYSGRGTGYNGRALTERITKRLRRRWNREDSRFRGSGPHRQQQLRRSFLGRRLQTGDSARPSNARRSRLRRSRTRSPAD